MSINLPYKKNKKYVEYPHKANNANIERVIIFYGILRQREYSKRYRREITCYRKWLYYLI